MQFKTKLGLVDVPNEEVLSAANSIGVASISAATELLGALDRIEAAAVNLHCALQSTAYMDPRDSRIAAITGSVVRDLLVLRDQARAAIAKATA